MDVGPLHPSLLHRLFLRGLEVRRFLARALDGSQSPAARSRRLILPAAAALALLAGCARDDRHVLIIGVTDQRMVLLEDGAPIASYAVSTSKFGLGDKPGSNCTPTGTFRVRKKIGADAPTGMKFKDRRPTGEIVAIDAPGRDPVVTRILWLDGLEPDNRNAYGRHIYIHGTPEERNIGTPASYGCIRMRSRDVIELFDRVGVGARVKVLESLPPGS